MGEPAATEGSGDSQAADSPGKLTPKSEANKKALESMYDAMAPLTGKKNRKDSDDEESDDTPRRGRGRRNRAKSQQNTTPVEESPEATTNSFKNVLSFTSSLFHACLFQTSQYVCIGLFVLGRSRPKRRPKRSLRKRSGGFSLSIVSHSLSREQISQ